MFDQSVYKENVEYCKYVWRINNERNLMLDIDEIQIIANMYYEALKAQNLLDDLNSYIEDESILNEVFKEFVMKYGTDPEKEEYPNEEDYKKRAAEDKAKGAHGGYGYNDLYDDFGLDEKDFDEGIKL